LSDVLSLSVEIALQDLIDHGRHGHAAQYGQRPNAANQ
jgi:hypothetical protein